MLAEIGLFATGFSLLSALYAIIASVVGERIANERIVLTGRNAALLTFALLTTATVVLQTAIMTQEYQIAYVWSVSSPPMPTFFRWTAIWGSQAGSLLFWSFLMSAFAAASIAMHWKNYRRLMPYAIAIMMAVVAFFVAITLSFENPFERWWIGEDGEVLRTALIPAGAAAPDAHRLSASAQGLNPMLRHFGMAIHPPMLYLGFVGFIVPFAFGAAALASGDLSTNWIKASRRWALIAWIFLSLGLVLGGRWAYDVLGWGGYWGWDPVENAALLPWLTGTALLHSVMIQEKRSMLKTWNMVLVITTFSAVIFGTFATRSGLVESVHSFARSDIGFPMFFFWFSLTLVSVLLLIWRRSQGRLRDDHRFKNIFSRESLFVLNNFVFMALFGVVFWGSFGAPILSEMFMDTDITLGTDYFMKVTPPLFAVLFVLMGVAPLSAWGMTSIKRLGRSLVIPFILTALTLMLLVSLGMNTPIAIITYAIVLLAGWVAIVETGRGVMARVRAHREDPFSAFFALLRRNPRRYGGYMVHLGVTIVGLGIVGSTLFQVETQRTLAVGESLTIENYELRYDSVRQEIADDNRIMDIAEVTVFRNGEMITTLSPRRDFFQEGEGTNSMTIAGTHSTLENDFYVILVGWEEIGASSATFKVYINPLVNLIWWGSIVLILGTVFAVWPKEMLSVHVRQQFQQPVTGRRALAGKGI